MLRFIILVAMAMVVFAGAGYIIYPFLFPLPAKQVAVEPKPEPVVSDQKPEVVEPVKPDKPKPVVKDDTPVDDVDEGVDDGKEDTVSNIESTDFMPAESGLTEQFFQEDDVPVDPAQASLPPVYSNPQVQDARRMGDQLARALEQEEKNSRRKGYFKSTDLTAAQWADAITLRQALIDKILSKLGQFDQQSMMAFLQDPANRLDLARLTLINKAGTAKVSEIAKSSLGGRLLETMGGDLGWMYGLLYSGPAVNMDKTLDYMNAIFMRNSEELNNPLARRVATTTALEFAREGWNESDMLERFSYYFNSARSGQLNAIFDTLHYWDTRLVTGCMPNGGWGGVKSLQWQRDNVRLPVQGYLDACNQIQYRLRNAAGDTVFSTSDYIGPYLRKNGGILALAYREIGGVCGACSHYGAYGALAAGIPAMTMGEPGHCAYTVRVGDKWEKSYTIYWQRGMHKTFWKEHEWDFLELMQALYTDEFKTLASDQVLALGDVLSTQRKVKAAATCYENSVIIQPLNWMCWLRYAGYLGKYGKENKAKWKEIHDLSVDTLARKYHAAAATLLRKYIYPTLLPLVTNAKERNKMYASFFSVCDTHGTNRWDIANLLNAQIRSLKDDKEKLDFMKTTLRTLMSKPDYAPSALSWGMDFLSTNSSSSSSEEMSEDFYKLVIGALSRARVTSKEADETWRTLGEAISTAADNSDRRAFQAIGKLAQRKFRKKFPRTKFAVRSTGGRLISETGLIQTAVTLSESERYDACLHWGVLQKTGGVIPGKFEGKAGLKVELERTSEITGAVCVLGEKARTDRPFVLEVSEDGQNWNVVCPSAQVQGSTITFTWDSKKAAVGRFVRMTREGDKYEVKKILGFFVYGKQLRNRDKDK